MDRNHKSEEGFGRSTSSSSRRVMWKLNEEEETFDSLVNYRRHPSRSRNRNKVSDVPTKGRTASENCQLPSQELETQSASNEQGALGNMSASPPQTTRNPHQSSATSLPEAKGCTASENCQLLSQEVETKSASNDQGALGKMSVSLPQQSWNANQSSATSLPEAKEISSKEQAIIYWRRLFDGIHKRQRGERKISAMQPENPTDVVLTSKTNLALRYKPSHESLKNKRIKDLAPERCPSTSRGSTSCKLVSDLKMETFSLPPQQTCVVREVEPRFGRRRRMLLANDTDSCYSGELEVPKNSPVQEPGSYPRSELISVHVSAPTSCSFTGATRRNPFPTRHRTAASKVAAETKGGPSPAVGGNKCSSVSSGSAGTNQLPNFRQRQQELHRYRVMIEQRRLDLLELKIAREREEALHSEVLFHKELQIKENMIKVYEDNDCSNA
ncbi:uncharacterized protein LOC6607219 isoform X1 [Drosophila sechellia]|uniref:GM23756 n=1 Tax=Drosophila sechellia TaxID=7238 RepID=B4HL25_DROSE|nr:uncharacterized protein LOC6607219 isoform X1 [Drosophila sechellia]EDW42989.1 GM23756 [Drosophila sechellia]